jgi:hypothetical protein
LYGCETWAATSRKEHAVKMPEKRMLRKIYGKKKEGTAKWRKLRTEKFHNSTSSNVVRVFKTMRV